MSIRKAKVVRIVTPDHFCPWGLKALDLLRRKGFDIEDEHLESSEANKAYKKEHDVSETPQIFIEGKRIGGYDDLRDYLGLRPEGTEGKNYQPVIAIFVVSLLLALATSHLLAGALQPGKTAELFVPILMCLLGVQKLQNLSTFTTSFVQYDLLAQKDVRYAYLYPFVETGAGIFMIAQAYIFIAAPAALFVASISGISVFKAVYLEKRDLKCACTGGGDGVPLGFVSLVESILMVGMSLWMLFR